MERVIFLRKSQLDEEGVWEEPQGLGATGWTFSRLSRVRTVSWEGWPCSENSYGEDGSTAKTGQGRSKPEALECAVAFHQVLLHRLNVSCLTSQMGSLKGLIYGCS